MNNKINSSYKVIADHLRSSAFLIADGIIPSNEGRGYVLRRIMRRAMLHCYKINEKKSFFYQLVPSLVEQMSEAFPELQKAQDLITDTLKIEEERFRKTVANGMDLLETQLNKSTNKVFSGKVAFKLYDTYGFPLDLTQNILKEKNIEVNLDEFKSEMKQQKERAKKNWSGSGEIQDDSLYFKLKEKYGATKFLGYESTDSKAKILSIIIDGKEVPKIDQNNENAIILLDQTPFYATSGGQKGDEGYLKLAQNTIEISETKKLANCLFAHHVKNITGEFKVGDEINATTHDRDSKAKNHSVTHLLHYVLKKNLGNQLTQKGSNIESIALTFDFNHNKQVESADLRKIEDEVNELILENSEVTTQVMNIEDAKKKGAMALFGEKYDDVVRVLSMANDKSIEFCGGIHVKKTGDIGLFKIVSEKSIAAGIRRITARTDKNAIEFMQDSLNKLGSQTQELFSKLSQKCDANKINQEIKINSIGVDIQGNNNQEKIIDFRKKKQEFESQNQELLEALKQLDKKLKKAKLDVGDVSFSAEKLGDINFIHHLFEDIDAKDLRNLITGVKSKKENSENSIILFFSTIENKVAVCLSISQDLTDKLNAGKLIGGIVEKIGGKGGGGKPDLAFGGGVDKSGIKDAVNEFKDTIT